MISWLTWLTELMIMMCGLNTDDGPTSMKWNDTGIWTKMMAQDKAYYNSTSGVKCAVSIWEVLSYSFHKRRTSWHINSL